MDLQKRIDFNQFIKEKINEKILKRKILKGKLLKLNSMRNLIERLISNHHQSLYYVSVWIGLEMKRAFLIAFIDKLFSQFLCLDGPQAGRPSVRGEGERPGHLPAGEGRLLPLTDSW